jgi:hypothetical protein
MGLKEQIKKAGSESQINDLLVQGRSFDMASDKTKNAWLSSAKKRLVELKCTPPTPPQPVSEETSTAVVKKKTKVKKS